MKECINCKTILEDDELFCHECGAKQEVQETGTQVEETQVEPEGKKCIHCGKAIEIGSVFCPFCGEPQDVENVEEEQKEEPQPESVKPPQPEQPQEQPKEPEHPEEQPVYYEEDENSIPWRTILLAVLIAAGAGWYFFIRDTGDTTPKDSNKANLVEKPIDNPPVVEEVKSEPTTPLAFLEEFYNILQVLTSNWRRDQLLQSLKMENIVCIISIIPKVRTEKDIIPEVYW